ncbi:hypothetical protein MIR68_012202 [Amoeboaphelidium protococcarum]|nr:hypothetical protein MIR68_012202 [Amoeboaphelidium protococcarum]
MSSLRGRTSPHMTRAFSIKEKEKAEHELSISVKKALNQDETAPKQKHVRICAVFTWDFKTAQPFWNAVKMQPVLSDEIQCFKALITIHKVLRDGHSCALEECMREVPFLDTMERAHTYGGRGYSTLIQVYIQFIKAKLQFHTMHPEFTANMSYEEYRALKKVDDVNEGYITITELMDLQDTLDRFQKTIFDNFRPNSNNECKISALVPLVEESYGIYQFLNSMLTAMHKTVDAVEAMEPLRLRYRQQYEMLRKFYFECSNLRYLTSLITVPTLPPLPPDFTNSQALVRRVEPEPPREKTPPVDDLWGSVSNITPEPTVIQSDYERQQMIMRQQLIQNNSHLDELQNLKNQLLQAQQIIQGYESRMQDVNRVMGEYQSRMQEYERQLHSKSSWDLQRAQKEQEVDGLIKQLQDQVAMWKAKYENVAAMYAQLRKEHLDVLQKFKEVQKQALSVKDVVLEKEKLAQTMKAKFMEMEDLKKERDQFKNQLEKQKDEGIEQVALLRRQAADAKARFEELSMTKGAETQKLVAQFKVEKDQSEQLLKQQLEDQNLLKDDLRNLKSELERLKEQSSAKDEEILVLQAGLDQSLMALQNLQSQGSSNEASLLGKIDSLSLEHRSQMDKIMDSVLDDCKNKASDAMFELDSSAHNGNQTATAEIVLSLLDKTSSQSNDFAASFSKHLVGGDASGESQAEAIKNATNLAQSVYYLASNSKGLLRLVEDVEDSDAVSDKLIKQARVISENAKFFYHRLQSAQLASVDFTQRPQKVQEYNAQLQSTLSPLTQLVSSLVSKDARGGDGQGEEFDKVVEDEMLAASKAIQDAIDALLKLQKAPRDPKLTQTDLAVHDSILTSARAITDAIARLIVCATNSQKEIVSNGKGSGSAAAFYKKNSRWIDGLISAAKAVAAATKLLVESADGVIQGTHSMEQLVVAAQEVSGATAQLVAAARVKAIRGSKTQDSLEVAARAVTDGTRMLVKVVQQLRDSNSKQGLDKDVDFSKLSAHEFKKKEMEQQVQILKLEQSLSDARSRLGVMRRQAYHKEGDYNLQ